MNDNNDHLKGFDTSSYVFQIPELEYGWASSFYDFPKRIFIMGGGPTLQILYDNRFRAKDWGDWADIRPDIAKPILDVIKPTYSIRLFPDMRDVFPCLGKKVQEGRPRGNSLCEFLLLFEEHGGEEAFLFGFDGSESGYWVHEENYLQHFGQGYTHRRDAGWFNNAYLPISSLKLYHIGQTTLNVTKILDLDNFEEKFLQ